MSYMQIVHHFLLSKDDCPSSMNNRNCVSTRFGGIVKGAVLCFVIGRCVFQNRPAVSAQADQAVTEIRSVNSHTQTSSKFATIAVTNGVTYQIGLKGELLTDLTLGLISQMPTIRDLVFQGGTMQDKISADGISQLSALTNLDSLHIGCFGKMKPGLFAEICKLKQLRSLALDISMPPPVEYAYITNLDNLEVLKVNGCTNFNNDAAYAITNLTKLKTLTLRFDGVSSNVKSSFQLMTNLTLIDIRYGTAPPR